MIPTMKQSPDYAGNQMRERATFAACISLLIFGFFYLYSMTDNLPVPSDFLFGFISFTYIVAVMGIKNANTGQS
jgi:hypothetical protein